MQLQFSLCLNIERQWGWSCFYYYYFLCGIKSTSVMACELFQHSLCKIRVWQGVSIDRSVVEIEQTWINKGQNCQQEECPVACEDLLLNSIRKARSCPRAEPKAPEQTSNFLRIFTIDTYLKKKINFSHPPFLFSILKCSETYQVPKWPKLLKWRKWQFQVCPRRTWPPMCTCKGITGPCIFPSSTLSLYFSFLAACDVSQQFVEAKCFSSVLHNFTIDYLPVAFSYHFLSVPSLKQTI